ncbi:DUF185-domain-containing protein [Crassisporium funariophilum]|nr:DUF185-domain-containing protein [Crassisporium funariophilum]
MTSMIRTCRRAWFLNTPQWQRARPTSVSFTRLKHSGASEVTKVEKIMLDNIKATGPFPFSTYMQLCLSHPTDGYYMNSSNKVFGSGGDFITSPEISQVFGELVGIWLLSQWANSGKKHPFRLVELGPGRGTLMDDILRVTSQLVPAGQKINVHLVETSNAMRALQQTKLTANGRVDVELHWHNSISEIPQQSSEYTMLVAHEFFDALPIHIIQKMETGWHEVLVASNTEPQPDVEQKLEESNNPQNSIPTSQFRRVLAPNPSPASTLLGFSSSRFQDLPVGSSLEVSPTAFRTAYTVGELLSCRKPDDDKPNDENTSVGGCGLIIDYGGDQAFGDSFRAFKEHKIVDVFHEPGKCDLTANVDFGYLKEAMSNLVTTYGPIPQGAFLANMGLQLRLQSLLKNAATDTRRDEIRDAAARLVDPMGMGKEYQVMGITNHLPAGSQVWPFVEQKST